MIGLSQEDLTRQVAALLAAQLAPRAGPLETFAFRMVVESDAVDEEC